jgi:hypothetical protein
MCLDSALCPPTSVATQDVFTDQEQLFLTGQTSRVTPHLLKFFVYLFFFTWKKKWIQIPKHCITLQAYFERRPHQVVTNTAYHHNNPIWTKNTPPSKSCSFYKCYTVDVALYTCLHFSFNLSAKSRNYSKLYKKLLTSYCDPKTTASLSAVSFYPEKQCLET